MTNLNIEHYPNKGFTTFAFKPAPLLIIDLNQSVREKLNEGEQLTNDTALNILKRIKLKSDILSFLTKPIVFIPLSAGLFVAGLCIPLYVAHIFICVCGMQMFKYSINNHLVDFLSQLSQAYNDQSQRAYEYIRTLEANHEMTLTLNDSHINFAIIQLKSF